MALVTSAEAVCSRCRSSVESGDLRCPVCNLAVVEAARRDDSDVRIEVLRCDECGAAVTYNLQKKAPTCAFCGSTQHVEMSKDPPERCDTELAFTVDRERAGSAYRRWLAGQGWLCPDDLATSSCVESMRGLWWAGWLVNAESLVSWTADSDFGRKRAPWAPHAGQFESKIENLVIAATRGLDFNETSFLIPSYRLSEVLDVPVEPTSGYHLEHFDLPRSSARRFIRDRISDLARATAEAEHIPGSEFRRFSASILLRRLVTRRCVFPAWVIAYRYGGRLYRIVISGHDEQRIIGNVPTSKLKIASLAAAGLAGLVGLLWFLAKIL